MTLENLSEYDMNTLYWALHVLKMELCVGHTNPPAGRTLEEEREECRSLQERINAVSKEYYDAECRKYAAETAARRNAGI